MPKPKATPKPRKASTKAKHKTKAKSTSQARAQKRTRSNRTLQNKTFLNLMVHPVVHNPANPPADPNTIVVMVDDVELPVKIEFKSRDSITLELTEALRRALWHNSRKLMETGATGTKKFPAQLKMTVVGKTDKHKNVVVCPACILFLLAKGNGRYPGNIPMVCNIELIKGDDSMRRHCVTSEHMECVEMILGLPLGYMDRKPLKCLEDGCSDDFNRQDLRAGHYRRAHKGAEIPPPHVLASWEEAADEGGGEEEEEEEEEEGDDYQPPAPGTVREPMADTFIHNMELRSADKIAGPSNDGKENLFSATSNDDLDLDSKDDVEMDDITLEDAAWTMYGTTQGSEDSAFAIDSDEDDSPGFGFNHANAVGVDSMDEDDGDSSGEEPLEDHIFADNTIHDHATHNHTAHHDTVHNDSDDDSDADSDDHAHDGPSDYANDDSDYDYSQVEDDSYLVLQSESDPRWVNFGSD
ncbi:hypothetical protein BXZ70DRAFT_1008963 [Cristinia sonorae]|uniref:C2H2-type domain-containing protein n=1 Tax=Cristinia sonorae TaxID=1940300 RepID=A0A8K0XNZ1_9AGAR|nr:hypothetical protein BXZ70DRAFT_1008963 [Cristinia sonorae]